MGVGGVVREQLKLSHVMPLGYKKVRRYKIFAYILACTDNERSPFGESDDDINFCFPATLSTTGEARC